MTKLLRPLLLATVVTASGPGLSGCIGMTVAGIAANVIGSAISGPQTAGTPPSPSERIYEGLSQLDDRVSPACTAALAKRQDEALLPDGEPSTAGNPWNDPAWRFGQDAPSVALAAVSSGAPAASSDPRLGKNCAVRPTCLPGMEKPVRMMVCERTPAAARGDTGTASRMHAAAPVR